MKVASPLVFFCCIAATLAEESTFYGKIYPVPSSLPQPKTFFPLTDGSGTKTATWPSTAYTGTFNSQKQKADWWVADDVFGHVMYCAKNTSDYLALPPVQYGSSGNFSIAFWLKPAVDELTGTFFQYLYSHSAYGSGSTVDIFAPNSVNIYLPADEHPAFGLVRTAVKDDTDSDVSSFLDSDGTYNNNNPRISNTAQRVTDGAWHFVAVTSRSDGEKGFLVYVDGSLAAQLPPQGYQTGDSSVQLDGGNPLDLRGNITLCSRDNYTEDRFFSGSLSHLSLFDVALTTQQVSELYRAVPVAASSPPAAAPTLGSSAWLDQYNGSPFLQSTDDHVALCLANVSSTTRVCSQGYSCTPLSPNQISSLGSEYSSMPVGVCAKPNGLQLPTDSIPVPALYFPFSSYTATSWPLPDQWFWNTSADAPVTWAQDTTFGTVVDCDALSKSTLSIGPQTWGSSGSFAINLWMQQRGNLGSYFQYLLSARSNDNGPIQDTTIDVYKPNEVHIYLPESGHPAANLVRAIVKDSNDVYSGPPDENFLDSDGLVGSNLPRNTSRLQLTDGRWHMVTLTTLPSAEKGFAIYIDGLLMAVEQEPQSLFSVSGGDPMFVNGNIVLCGRTDLATERFFDGKIAQLSIFNNALTSQTISTLYRQVYDDPPQSSVQASYGRNGTPGSPSTPPGSDSLPPLFDTPSVSTTGVGLQQPGQGSSQNALSGQGQPSEGSGLSGGATAGIVIGALAGVVLLTALVALVVSTVRGRRMSGVSRLQEVTMPEINPSPPEERYVEDQYAVTLNKKALEAEQRKAAEV